MATRLATLMSQPVKIARLRILLGMFEPSRLWNSAMLMALTSFLMVRTLTEHFGGARLVDANSRVATLMHAVKNA